MIRQYSLSIRTPGRSTIEITSEINDFIKQSGIQVGLCHIFIRHTSASLIITENADSNVRRDLENYIAKLVLDGDPAYIHDQEGPDDMAAHIRSVFTQTEMTIPVTSGQAALGTWQGLYVWEHRTHAHQRQLVITINGERN
ncbi:MAG: secondary thiamine-phosphate synthase enzyme [Gammaproteobacteria bacterium]|jgi:secondary thiamine-phosphate synthase enzyme